MAAFYIQGLVDRAIYNNLSRSLRLPFTHQTTWSTRPKIQETWVEGAVPVLPKARFTLISITEIHEAVATVFARKALIGNLFTERRLRYTGSLNTPCVTTIETGAESHTLLQITGIEEILPALVTLVAETTLAGEWVAALSLRTGETGLTTFLSSLDYSISAAWYQRQ
jgi:hypothetical protein